MSVLVKPNLKVFDPTHGLVVERREGNVGLGFMTPKGLVQITYRDEKSVRIILNTLSDMMERLDEDNVMPGPMEERIKRLRTKVAALSVKIDKQGAEAPEFVVVLTFKGEEENVEYQTAPFKFLTQAVMAAEGMVKTWAEHESKTKEQTSNDSNAKPAE